MSQLSIREVQDAALKAFPLIRDEVTHLFSKYGTEQDEVNETLWMLFKYQSERSQAVSFLVSHGYWWDSEIILRSFYECTAKIVFICTAKRDERQKLITEFRSGLVEIFDRKRSNKAEFAKRAVDEADAFSFKIFEALQDEEMFSIKSDKNKAQRKALENKWSFSSIIETLSRSYLAGRQLSDVKSLLHIYGVASHLIHADQAALDFMIDRGLRESTERQLLEASHICRIFSDQIHLTFLSAEALRIMFDAKFNQPDRVAEAIKEFNDLCAPFNKAFADTQESFYSRR